MGLHFIIGKGNLGLDLQSALDKSGHDARVLTSSDGFECPRGLQEIEDMKPDCVWVTAGKGSVSEAESPHEIDAVLNTHLALPISLAKRLQKETRLAVFSTDYVADESKPDQPSARTTRPKSVYAAMKIGMEMALESLARPRTTIFRVGSLYGGHFVERTFPGKVAKRHAKPGPVTMPMNWVTPTPTWWVADTLACNYDSVFSNAMQTHHIAPQGGCTILQWGRAILGDDYVFKSSGFDNQRPAYSNLGLSFNSLMGHPHFHELWDRHLAKYSDFPGVRK